MIRMLQTELELMSKSQSSSSSSNSSHSISDLQNSFSSYTLLLYCCKSLVQSIHSVNKEKTNGGDRTSKQHCSSVLSVIGHSCSHDPADEPSEARDIIHEVVIYMYFTSPQLQQSSNPFIPSIQKSRWRKQNIC